MIAKALVLVLPGPRVRSFLKGVVNTMLRVMAFMSVVAGLVSAFIFYAINYDTRRLEQATFELSERIEKTRRDIAVLKAERALLANPANIEPYARALGLEPAKSTQFYSLTSHAGAKADKQGFKRPSSLAANVR